MAFKMTPGMKGNPASNRIAGLGACGGPGQPPCPPRFQQEKTAELVADRSSTSRSKYIKSKKKAAVVAPAPAPVKLQINLPKGYEFKSKKQEAMFYEKFSDLSGFKSQEELDKAIKAQLTGIGPVKPTPIEGPVFEAPIIAPAPVKGGESEAVVSKPKVKAVAAK